MKTCWTPSIRLWSARARAQDTADHTALRNRYCTLTVREREVMTHIVRGLLNKQTAADLGIAEITVKVHRRHIMQKMGVRSLADLVRISEKLA